MTVCLLWSYRDVTTRHLVEHEQRAFVAEFVRQVPARERVQCRKEIIQPRQHADGEDGRRAGGQALQVERQEPFGHVLAHADEHHHPQHPGHAAPQAEVISDALVCRHEEWRRGRDSNPRDPKA